MKTKSVNVSFYDMQKRGLQPLIIDNIAANRRGWPLVRSGLVRVPIFEDACRGLVGGMLSSTLFYNPQAVNS